MLRRVAGAYPAVVTMLALFVPAHASAATTTSCPRVTASWHRDGPWHARDVTVRMSHAAAAGIAARLPVIEGSRVTTAEVPCGVGYSVAATMGPAWTARYGIATVRWRAEGVTFPLGKFQCNSSGAHVKWPLLTCRRLTTRPQEAITVGFEIGPV